MEDKKCPVSDGQAVRYGASASEKTTIQQLIYFRIYVIMILDIYALKSGEMICVTLAEKVYY